MPDSKLLIQTNGKLWSGMLLQYKFLLATEINEAEMTLFKRYLADNKRLHVIHKEIIFANRLESR